MAETVKKEKNGLQEISFLDLKVQYRSIRKEILEAMEEVLESQAFILGPTVQRFEERVASYLQCRAAVGVASGTDALLLSLMALGIGPGDAVLVPTFTFFSSAACITRLGATPIFVDIDPDSYLLDIKQAEDLLGQRSGKDQACIKAILPVHLFGQCCEMGELLALAHRYKLHIVEDVAQAFGSEVKLRKGGPKAAGTIGDLGCFSFFPTKSLGGFGDGGLVATNHQSFADKIRKLRVHGQGTKYYHEAVGINSRLDALQAAVLEVKLRYLDQWCDQRIQHARYYKNLFSSSGLVKDKRIFLPASGTEKSHIYNYYVIRSERRDELKQHLAKSGIQSLVYYPLPLHLQPCFEHLGYHKGDLPISELVSTQALAIPMYPELTSDQQEIVVQRIVEFYRK
jgi:dTDP-4-amino-4,6-dideoxygalactose transaminase